MLMATQSPAVVVGTTAFLLILEFAIVILRLVARKKRRQPLQSDDWLCLISTFLSCGLAAILFIAVAQKALAYPTPDIMRRTSLDTSNDKVRIVARLQYIFLIISVLTLGTIKSSVLCFYRRIFVVDKTNSRNLPNLMYLGMICIISLWTGAFLLSFIFACKGNFAAWWTSAMSLITHCVNTLELFFAFAVSDFISDVLILLMPLPSIWKLHLPVTTKIGVLIVFLLGILATIASLVRMIWVTWARIVGFDISLDQDLLITTSLFWNMVEISIGIIACCLPTLRGLFQKRSIDSVVLSIRERLSIGSRSPSSKSQDTIQLTQSHRGEWQEGPAYNNV